MKAKKRKKSLVGWVYKGTDFNFYDNVLPTVVRHKKDLFWTHYIKDGKKVAEAQKVKITMQEG